jgi:hypothetical protein
VLGHITELKSALTVVLATTPPAPLAGDVAITVGGPGLGACTRPHPATTAAKANIPNDIFRILNFREFPLSNTPAFDGCELCCERFPNMISSTPPLGDCETTEQRGNACGPLCPIRGSRVPCGCGDENRAPRITGTMFQLIVATRWSGRVRSRNIDVKGSNSINLELELSCVNAIPEKCPFD